MVAGSLLLITDYADGDSAAAGGAGVAIGDSYRALRAAGMRSDLVTGFGLAAMDTVSLGGADIREAGLRGAWRTVANPAARIALGKVLQRYDPSSTVVVLHQWTRYLSPAAIDLLREFPLMVYMHDHFWACPNGAYYDFNRGQQCERKPFGLACISANCDRAGRAHKAVRLVRHSGRLLAARKPNAGRIFLHLSDRACTVAGPLLPGERHEVIHNPLTVSIDQKAPHSRSYDFGYFGRLEPEKGINDLLAAMVDSGLKGLFVGSGSLSAEVRRTSGATHQNWLPRKQIAAWMGKCAAVVLPSRWPETWGLVTAEAMASGVPVIVSNRAGSSDLVQRFGGGIIFDPSEQGALGRALVRGSNPRLVSAIQPDQRIALRALLSPTSHAARLRAFAYETWGIEVATGKSETTSLDLLETSELAHRTGTLKVARCLR